MWGSAGSRSSWPGIAPFTAGVILSLATHSGLTPWGMVNVNYNKFSGGTRVFPSGLAPRSLGLKLLVAALVVLALLLAVYMRLYYQLRPLNEDRQG